MTHANFQKNRSRKKKNQKKQQGLPLDDFLGSEKKVSNLSKNLHESSLTPYYYLGFFFSSILAHLGPKWPNSTEKRLPKGWKWIPEGWKHHQYA